MKWKAISESTPPLDTEVLFCCRVDNDFTEVQIGRHNGQKTEGNTLVMEGLDDWYPCSHWMPLPDPPSDEEV